MNWSDAFLDEIAAAAWFAACGEPLLNGECQDAAQYLSSLELDALPITAVASWREAAAATQRPDWSREWWEAERADENRLRDQAARRWGDKLLRTELSRVAIAAHELMGAASSAASRGGVADEALARVAAGAAAQACHQAGLARAAEAGSEHAFAAKFRLYASGRWVLGVAGGKFFLF